MKNPILISRYDFQALARFVYGAAIMGLLTVLAGTSDGSVFVRALEHPQLDASAETAHQLRQRLDRNHQPHNCSATPDCFVQIDCEEP